MTQDDYEWIRDLNINNNEYEIKSNFDINDTISRGTTHETKSKRITLAKSCNTTYCVILFNAKWLKEPNNRSYDVIGARLRNTELFKSTISTKITTSKGTTSTIEANKFFNGFGASIKLPTSGTDILIEQKFYTKSGGEVFASYQHSTKKISLATSKLYTIGASGAGGVFKFTGAATDAFDKMGGVDISLN